MTELGTIRERHKSKGRDQHDMCQYDNEPWPCDTRVVLDALAKADAASVDDVAALQEAVAIGDRAEAHAKALAEALREATRQTTSENDGLTERWR